MSKPNWIHITRFIRRLTKWDGFWWISGIAVVLLIGGVLSWHFWEDLNDGKDSLSTIIRNLGFVIGGVIAVLLAVWRSRIGERQANAAQRQAEITRSQVEIAQSQIEIARSQAQTAQQSLLNERYQRGAEMLGSSVLSVRMGGIYALQRLGEEHPDEYHIQIMRLFCAFVRNPTGSEGVPHKQYSEDEPGAFPILREDVQVVMTAIGSRSQIGLDLEKSMANFKLELDGADLGGANLYHANLAGGNLSGVNLVHSGLRNSDLSRANLAGATLRRAYMATANLSGANMPDTNLSYATADFANLSGVHLDRADLSRANLEDADLSGAVIGAVNLAGANLQDTNLSGAVFRMAERTTPSLPPMSGDLFARLTQEQLDQAKSDPDNPPKIGSGTVDIETGQPLVWHGTASNHSP